MGDEPIKVRQVEPDAHYTANTKLEVYNAVRSTSAVRLEIDDCGSGVLHIIDGKQHEAMRVTWSTLICLRKVMELWKSE